MNVSELELFQENKPRNVQRMVLLWAENERGIKLFLLELCNHMRPDVVQTLNFVWFKRRCSESEVHFNEGWGYLGPRGNRVVVHAKYSVANNKNVLR